MKQIFDLKHSLNNKEFFEAQFSEENKREKNVVFVNPQLSDNNLYTMILPYFWFNVKGSNVSAAITKISEFNTEKQLFGDGEWEQLTDDMIRWATSIVLPFTAQPLSMNLYAHIRSVNPNVAILYNVDFDFYNLDLLNPYKYIFDEQTVINAVEDNMFHADVVIVSNVALQEYLYEVFGNLLSTKYENTAREALENFLRIECMPLFIDKEIVLGNVDYTIQETISSREKVPDGRKDFFDKLSSVANEEIKKEAEIKKAKGKVKEKDNYKGKPYNQAKVKKEIKKHTPVVKLVPNGKSTKRKTKG
jgi:flagellar biosynthesis protein FlhB